jgi:hypothetical protein
MNGEKASSRGDAIAGHGLDAVVRYSNGEPKPMAKGVVSGCVPNV